MLTKLEMVGFEERGLVEPRHAARRRALGDTAEGGASRHLDKQPGDRSARDILHAEIAMAVGSGV